MCLYDEISIWSLFPEKGGSVSKAMESVGTGCVTGKLFKAMLQCKSTLSPAEKISLLLFCKCCLGGLG